jgi:hypothetical protein
MSLRRRMQRARARTIDWDCPVELGVHVSAAELADVLDGAEDAGCPFCGEPIAISCPKRMILHVAPNCPRFAQALASVDTFEAVVFLLAEKTVCA